jgi:hypothetical protein
LKVLTRAHTRLSHYPYPQPVQSSGAPDLRDGCSPVPPLAAFQWLDDQQLGALSTAELEDVMDRYLLSVVQQLVQVGRFTFLSA